MSQARLNYRMILHYYQDLCEGLDLKAVSYE